MNRKGTKGFNAFKNSVLVLVSVLSLQVTGQTVAMQWNETVLEGIRNDFARPNVHARNLYHVSAAMYDAWAVYDTLAVPHLLGNTLGKYTCKFNGVPKATDVEAARREAISYAAYRLIKHRFRLSPDWDDTHKIIDSLFAKFGYDTSITDATYSNGKPSSLGNFIAAEYIKFGFQDGANEANKYVNRYYKPINEPFYPEVLKTPKLVDPSRWQQLGLSVFVDQSGNVISGNIPEFLGPEWGEVVPFALPTSSLQIRKRDGFDWWLYHDPGSPPKFQDSLESDSSEFFKWAFSLVAMYGSQLDPSDGVMWDISPGALSNPDTLPTTLDGFRNFYDHEKTNYFGKGYSVNPTTGQAYAKQMVARGDFTRVLAEFWADGPDSETPPGHWFTILNYVNSRPGLIKKFKGKYDVKTDLEWDVKSYLIMGGAMHDCAVSSWGVKGYYDFIRPISAIRYLTSLGQSSNDNFPNYNVNGVKLVPGYIELVGFGDSLVGDNNENLDKIKLYTWKGHDFIQNPETDEAGTGWILAEDWWPYQRPTFVTPPFAGYVSGHSTYSMAAAVVLEQLTGDEYFPDGLGTFDVKKNEFLVFEEGPSMDFELQWAKYRDAAAQSAMSRIWGGIHPPIDDTPGRRMGMIIGADAISKAEHFFYRDRDGDGILSHMDCNDDDATIYFNAPELCDNKDNDCNGSIDDGIPFYTYFSDRDRDGFGSSSDSIVSCLFPSPSGYSLVSGDCDDANRNVYPGAMEVADNFIDEDCSGFDSTEKMMVFPNPSGNHVTVFKSADGTVQIRVLNFAGIAVMEREFINATGLFELDISYIAHGMYVIELVDADNKTFYGRLMRK